MSVKDVEGVDCHDGGGCPAGTGGGGRRRGSVLVRLMLGMGGVVVFRMRSWMSRFEMVGGSCPVELSTRSGEDAIGAVGELGGLSADVADCSHTHPLPHPCLGILFPPWPFGFSNSPSKASFVSNNAGREYIFCGIFLSFYSSQSAESTIDQGIHLYPQISWSHLQQKPKASGHVQWSCVRTDLHVRCEARALEMGEGGGKWGYHPYPRSPEAPEDGRNGGADS